MSSTVDIRLRELLDVAKKHDLAEICWEDTGMKVAFRRGASVPSAEADTAIVEDVPAAPVVPEELIVRSPMVGTFRRSDSKNHPPFVMEGNHITVGDRLGIVECMKVPTDVASFCAGEIKKVLVQDGQTVEYGQPLFMVKPAADEASQ